MSISPSSVPDPPSSRRFRWMAWRACVRWASWLLMLAVLAMSLAGLAGRHWPWELACHFRAQYAVLALVALGGFLIARRWRGALVASATLAWQLAGIVPLYWHAPATAQFGGAPLRLMSINVYADNDQHERVLSEIRRARVDVVFVLEVTDRWRAALAELDDEFPYSCVEPRQGNFGMAVYSRRPLLDVRVSHAGDSQYPLLEVEVEHDGRACTLIGAHPVPPRRRDSWAYRNAQLEFLATRAPHDRPVVVLGDLNTSSWSPDFADLLAATGLRDSRAGFGLQGSWPAALPGARVAIDHALVSPEVVVTQRELGAQVGSDHLPIVIEVELAPSAAKSE